MAYHPISSEFYPNCCHQQVIGPDVIATMDSSDLWHRIWFG